MLKKSKESKLNKNDCKYHTFVYVFITSIIILTRKFDLVGEKFQAKIESIYAFFLIKILILDKTLIYKNNMNKNTEKLIKNQEYLSLRYFKYFFCSHRNSRKPHTSPLFCSGLFIRHAQYFYCCITSK